MDATRELRHLVLSTNHIVEAERRIARQRDRVAELERDGHDTSEARDLLETMLKSLELMRSNQDHIVDELANQVMR